MAYKLNKDMNFWRESILHEN